MPSPLCVPTSSDPVSLHPRQHVVVLLSFFLATLIARQGCLMVVLFFPNGGLPRWRSGKESSCQCRGQGFDPWVRKIPWRRKWQPTPVFLPGKSCGPRNLASYSPWGRKRVRHDLATKQQQVVLNIFPSA